MRKQEVIRPAISDWVAGIALVIDIAALMIMAYLLS